MKTLTRHALFALTFSAFYSVSALADEPPFPFYENRSGLCGYYASEISTVQTFFDTLVKRGK